MLEATAFQGTDRFEVRGLLGHGTMGAVYEVYDRTRAEVVALKSLIRVEPATIYRLKREFRVLADVVHPNLVSLYELVADRDEWFFTMELVRGIDFLRYVRGPAPTAGADPARLRLALRQLATGVLALHEAGKVHRDLKPSNTLVTPEHRLVLLDFGITLDVTPHVLQETAAEGIVGTAAYMAPEQAAGTSASPASDWYAVGVMLYEALTGQLPFRGSVFQVLAAKQAQEPPPLEGLSPGLPPDLVTLCTALTARDPAARPSGADVAHVLGVAARAPVAVNLTAPPRGMMVGRGEALRLLDNALQAVQDGSAVMMQVYGPSGIGKSALARHFTELVQMDGSALVLAGRCYERESVPYKALDGVVEALSRHLLAMPIEDVARLLPPDVDALALLFPSLQRVAAIAGATRVAGEITDRLELRHRGFACLRTLLGRLARTRPLVLVVDDLQWADPESVGLLEDLLRPPDPPRLMLTLCFRSEDEGTLPFLRQLLDAPPTSARRHCRLQPLSDHESRRLADALLGASFGASSKASDAIVQQAAGSPFLVEELVRYAQYATGSGQGGHVALGEMLDARLHTMPDGARGLLAVLAVAARPVDPQVAFAAAGLTGDERPLMAALRSAHLIRSTAVPSRLELYHDRIRETIALDMNAATTGGLHLRLAECLEARGFDDPDVLLEHYLQGHDDARAGRYAAAAAAKANAALAFDRAAVLYQCALDRLGTAHPTRQSLTAALADALANAGRGRDAAAAYLDAVAGAAPALGLEYRRRAAEQLLISGHLEEGLVVIRSVLASVGLRLPPTPRHALASLLFRRLRLRLRGLHFREVDASAVDPAALTRIDICWAVAVGLGLVDNIRAADFQSLHLLLALRAGEPGRVARALATEAGMMATQGKPAQARTSRLLASARALAERIQSPHAEALCALIAGISHYHKGEWEPARDRAQSAERKLLELGGGVAWELSTAQLYQVYACYFLGDLPELAQRGQMFLRRAEERGNRFAAYIFQSGFGNLAWLMQDDLAGAHAAVSEARRRWRQEGFGVPHYLDMLARAHLHLYSGEASLAWDSATREWPALRGSFLLRIQGVRINMHHLRARCALAEAATRLDAARFLDSAERDAQRIRHEGLGWSDALARSLSGSIAAARGRTRESVGLLEEAAAELDRAAMALHATAVRWRLGELRGDAAGRQLASESAAWMRGRGIVNPERMLSMLMPGFPPPGPRR